MIFKKKGVLPIDKIGKWILALLFLGVLLFFIASLDISSYIKNLPGYKNTEATTLIKVEASDLIKESQVCGDLIRVGRIVYEEEDKFHWVYLSAGRGFERKTLIYIDGSNNLKYQVDGKKDFEIGNYLVEGKVASLFVDSDYYSYNSDSFQEIRFFPEVKIENFALLANAVVKEGTILCGAKEPIEVDEGFENLLVVNVNNMFVPSKNNLIHFEPYLDLKNTAFKSLLLREQENFFEITGYIGPFRTIRYLGRVYPDGSVWFDTDRLTDVYPGWFSTPEEKVKISPDVLRVSRKGMAPFYETNVRIDYEKLKENYEK